MTLSPIIVPDVHGEIGLLQQVLTAFPERDFVFLGDLIDRGPDSPAVVQQVIDLHAQGRARLCWGNHEEMLVRGVKHQHDSAFRCWLANGGEECLGQYQPDRIDLFKLHVDWIEEHAQPWVSVDTPHGRVLCSHATRPAPYRLADGYDATEAQREPWRYDAGYLWDSQLRSGTPLHPSHSYSVHGHVPQKRARWSRDGTALFLDVGSCFTGRLAVFDTNDKTIHTFEK